MIFTTFAFTLATIAGSGLGQAPASPATQPAEIAPAEPALPKPLLAEDWPAGVRPFGLHSPTITDDWFGLGPSMRDMGIDLKFFWNHHYFSVMGGGSETGTKFSATYDLFLTLDFEKMGLIEGGEMLVQARQQWGRSVNPWVGPPAPAGVRTRTTAMQVNDDADFDLTMYVDQLWYRQSFFEDKLALQVGYLDYQTIVDKNAYANSEDKQFMNEALDNNPLIPTSGATGLGATLYFKPCEWYSLIVGGADAQRLPLYKPGFSTTFHDEAWFLGYVENDFHVKIPTARGPLLGDYRVGMVYDPLPRTFYVDADEAPRRIGNDVGLYLSCDQMLLRENAEDTQGLGTFLRYAYHRDDTYRYNHFWSLGLSYAGLVPTRDKDVFGFGFAQLVDSDQYRLHVNPESGNETIYELYYAIQLTPWIVLTPDIQYVDNPGGSDADDVSHAIAGGFRVRMTF